MEHYLPITVLNDFIFCPYSIYLHQIYGGTTEDIYHSEPQSRGRRLHDFVEYDEDAASLRNGYVISHKLGIYGKIDEYNSSEKELIEYKSSAAVVYRGYYYQIWAQYLCLVEMGVEVRKLSFFDFSAKEKVSIPIPNARELDELVQHIEDVKYFDFATPIKVNSNKCMNCIYRNLCERSDVFESR